MTSSASCAILLRPSANLAAVQDKVELVVVDLHDQSALERVLREHRPTEVYNLASPSFVPRSWEYPVETAAFAAVGVTSLLEAVRAVDDRIRVYRRRRARSSASLARCRRRSRRRSGL